MGTREHGRLPIQGWLPHNWEHSPVHNPPPPTKKTSMTGFVGCGDTGDPVWVLLLGVMKSSCQQMEEQVSKCNI